MWRSAKSSTTRSLAAWKTIQITQDAEFLNRNNRDRQTLIPDEK